MEANELREMCREIVKRGTTTADERKTIREVCKEMDIKLNTKCPNCYIDAASIIYSRIPAPEASEEHGAYELKDGTDVTFGGIRVCAATLTDELAQNILAAGFPKYLFKSIPEK